MPRKYKAQKLVDGEWVDWEGVSVCTNRTHAYLMADVAAQEQGIAPENYRIVEVEPASWETED